MKQSLVHAARVLAGMVAGITIAILISLAAAASPPAPSPPEELRVLLLAVDGNDPIPRLLRHFEANQVINETWSQPATLHDFVFERSGSIANLFEEVSFGQLTMSGDTLLLSLPYAASDLTWTGWTSHADDAALAQGFDPSDYDRILYILPYLPDQAPATGLALGKRGWCAYLTRIKLDCLAHELGHTLGMRHAGERRADGTSNGLGDDSDGLMGSGFGAHANVVNKHLAGWLDDTRLAVFDKSGAENFRLAPQATSQVTLQAVKIVSSGAQPGTGVVDTFVSFRRSEGFDQQLQSSLADHNGDRVADSVLIHQWPRFFGNDTLYVRALKAGDFYEEHGVRVAVLGIGDRGATIRVTRLPYLPVAPIVSLSPPEATSKPGEFTFYTLSITNLNDPGEVSFDSHFQVGLPFLGPDWIVGWTSGEQRTVPPGETREFEFLIGSPSTAPPGIRGFGLRVTDADGDAGPVAVQVAGKLHIEP